MKKKSQNFIVLAIHAYRYQQMLPIEAESFRSFDEMKDWINSKKFLSDAGEHYIKGVYATFYRFKPEEKDYIVSYELYGEDIDNPHWYDMLIEDTTDFF